MNKLPVLGKGFVNSSNLDCLDIAQGVRGILRLETQLDLDVHLPTKGINLQRDLVWTQAQKEAFIESVIIRRQIPPISVLLTKDKIYQVIDGKQRLTTLLTYFKAEFEYCGYTIDQLPKEYYMQLERFHLKATRICEPFKKNEFVTDDEKIEWFCYINFAGVPQEIEHQNRLLGRA